MKNINIFRVIMVALLALSAQQVHCARTSSVVAKQAAVAINTGVGQDLALATTFAESELIVKKATENMNAARESLLSKSTTQAEDAQNVKIIIEQNYAIVMAKQKLEKMRDELAQKIEKDVAPEGYWSKFVAGAKNVGSGIASLFATGTGTEEEKETARQVIKGLTEQEVKVTEKYALLQKDLPLAEQAQLKARYEAIVAQFEAALYAQQLITGDMKSSMIKRSLLLGAAAAGTVAAGVMLKNKYFGAEELPSLQESDASVDRLTQEGRKAEGFVREDYAKGFEALRSGATSLGKNVREAMERGADEEDYIEKTYGPAATKYINQKIGESKQFASDFYEAATTPSFQKEGEEEGFTTTDYQQAAGAMRGGAASLGQRIRGSLERGADEEDYMEKTYGPTATKYIQDKYTAVKDYFTSPGQPAQNSDDVEGIITLKDLEPLTQSEMGQAAAKKYEEAKEFGAQKRSEWAQKKAEGLAAEQAEIEQRQSEEAEAGSQE